MFQIARMAFAPLLAMAFSGCAMTETTTTVQVRFGPVTQRTRLIRPDAAPVSAVWRQDGSSLLGQLSFTDACETETLQVNGRTQVTNTHSNRKYTTGAYVTGAVLSAIGIALIANAQGKSESVTCGSSNGTPKSGDRCDSEAGAWREVGAITIGAGLGAVLGGVIVHSRKPVVESKELPSEQQLRPQPNHHACGNVEAFEGAVVRAALSSGGTWTGIADRTGAVRIDLAGARWGRGARATASIESVRSAATGLPLAGVALGEVDLVPANVTARDASGARASTVR